MDILSLLNVSQFFGFFTYYHWLSIFRIYPSGLSILLSYRIVRSYSAVEGSVSCTVSEYRYLRKSITVGPRIYLLIRSIKFKVVEVILSRLYCTHVHSRKVPGFSSAFGRVYSITIADFSVRHRGPFKHFSRRYLMLHEIENWNFLILFLWLSYWLRDQYFGKLFTLFFHHFFENPNFLMKGFFLCLEGHDLIVIEFVSTEDFIVKLLNLFFMIAAHIFTELSPW